MVSTLTYRSANCISYFKVFRPYDLSNPCNMLSNDNAAASYENNLRISLFGFDEVDCFLKFPRDLSKS